MKFYSLVILLLSPFLFAQEGALVRVVPHVDYAQCFHIREFSGFPVLDVLNPNQRDKLDASYILIPRAIKVSSEFNDYQIIRTPVNRYVTLSTTHVFPLKVIGVLDKMVGIARSQDVSDQEIQKRLKRGEIKEVGLFQKATVETIVELAPDLVFVYGSGAPGEDLDSFRRMNIPTVLVSEFLESTPLGYAEWIKFFGVIFDQNPLAANHFSVVESEYKRLSNAASKLNDRPTVFANIPYGGTWFMPGGKSYLARILTDAGASYPWLDEPSAGSLKLSFESVIEKAVQADYWINPGNYLSLDSLKKADPRFQIFHAFTSGKVFNMNRKLLQKKPDDYFAMALSNPHMLLRDLIHIFHPSLLPRHELEWYHQLP